MISRLMGKLTALKQKPPGTIRARTPTVIQMEAVECGAASLAIILGHFGRFVPLETLRVDAGVSRDGTKATNVIKAAQNYGLIAKGFKKTPEKLLQMRMPVIVFWNFNHFLVLEGFSKKRIYLNDPACGPRTVTHEEFDQAFTGVVLAMEPGPDFKRGGVKKRLSVSLARRLGEVKPALAFIALSGLALVVPGIVIPVFTKVFIDNVLVAHMEDWLRPLLLAMAVIALLRGAITWVQQHYLLRLQTYLSLDMSSRFFRHVLRLPSAFFTQRFAGEIGTRVALNDNVANLLSGELATHFLSLLTVIFYAAVMFCYSPTLTLVGTGIASINFIVLRLIARKRKDANQKLLQERGKFMGVLMAGIMSVETVKAGGTEQELFATWAGHQTKVMVGEQELGVMTSTLNTIPALLSSLNTALILGLGSIQVINGAITIGSLVAFQGFMSSFMDPVNKLVGLGTRLQEVSGDMNRLDDVLHHETDPLFSRDPLFSDAGADGDGSSSHEEASETVFQLSGRLELKNITFGYSRMEPALVEDFNLELTPGRRVALVGGSGSGKSTIARVVCGIYQPWSGEVLFDGMPRHAVPRGVSAGAIAYVDQDVLLFEASIRENITLWDNTVAELDIIQAAKDAAIHDEITARPGGYDSLVQESGRNFSGGQKQRLELARAMACNPSILVLDEATSALDPTTEKLVDDSIRRRGCTCLIVAHRLSTIRDCDEIIILQRGKVVQRGTHESMKDTAGPYARLIGAE